MSGAANMLALHADDRLEADGLIARQRQLEREHLWAVDAEGRTYSARGERTHVSAPTELEAAMDRPGAEVRYHHTHPDERALSPTDLSVLLRVGVAEVWAHSPTHSRHGAALTDGLDRNVARAALGCVDQHAERRLAEIRTGMSLSEQDWEQWRYLAAMEALQHEGILRICWMPSAEAGRSWKEHREIPRRLRAFFVTALKETFASGGTAS